MRNDSEGGSEEEIGWEGMLKAMRIRLLRNEDGIQERVLGSEDGNLTKIGHERMLGI